MCARVHTHTSTYSLLHDHVYIWPHPYPYTNVWPEGGSVVLHKECLPTCYFVVFIVVSYHTQIHFITCPISQLCAQICPYYNELPGAVSCCFNENYKVYNIFNVMLHARLANPTCLQCFMVRHCSVCELRESNSKKENFGTY